MANSKVAGFDAVQSDKANELTIGTTAPSGPTVGWTWVDTSEDPPVSKVWTGTAWQRVGNPISDLTPQALSSGGSSSVGTSDQVSRADHEHGLPSFVHQTTFNSHASRHESGGADEIDIPTYSFTPHAIEPGSSGDDGSNQELSRGDHEHPTPGMWEVLTSGVKSGTGGLVISNFDSSYQMYRLTHAFTISGDGYLRMAFGGGGSADFSDYDYRRWDYDEDGSLVHTTHNNENDVHLVDQIGAENGAGIIEALFIKNDDNNGTRFRVDLVVTLAGESITSNDVRSKTHGRYNGGENMDTIQITAFSATWLSGGYYVVEGLKIPG